jgi:hypothetical protein
MKRQVTFIISRPDEDQQVVESPWLPDEIILLIFGDLKRGDIGACKKVSKTWERIGNHPSLNWVLAVKFAFRQFDMEIGVDNCLQKIKDGSKAGKLHYRFSNKADINNNIPMMGFGFNSNVGRNKVEVH